MRRRNGPTLIAVALTLASCAPSGGEPSVELTLHDRPVACDDGSGVCRDAVGVAQGEALRARVRLGSTRSALLLKARWRRPSSIYAELELVIPRPSGVGAPQVRYVERSSPEGVPLFEAAEASGRIELSRDARCPCQTGRFELLLRDAGPDGSLRTADDGLRRISRVRLRRDARPMCHGRAVLPIREGLLVVGERACPQQRRGWVGGSSACAWDGAAWVGMGWNDGWYDEEWRGDWDADDAWEEDGWDGDAWAGEAGEEEGWDGDDAGWDDAGWGDDAGDDGTWDDDGWSDDAADEDEGTWEEEGSDDGWWPGDDGGWDDDGGSSDDGSDDGWWDDDAGGDDGSDGDDDDGDGDEDDEGWW
jgi:hypothetical protein